VAVGRFDASLITETNEKLQNNTMNNGRNNPIHQSIAQLLHILPILPSFDLLARPTQCFGCGEVPLLVQEWKAAKNKHTKLLTLSHTQKNTSSPTLYFPLIRTYNTIPRLYMSLGKE
jgi:hypothetical protein